MPRHNKGHHAEQKRWEDRGQNLPNLQPRPVDPGPSTVMPPVSTVSDMDRDGLEGGLTICYCKPMGQNSVWKELQTTVDKGRICSHKVDMPESVARRFGFPLPLKRFRRKMYRKFDGKQVKAIGTMNLLFKERNGEEKDTVVLIWEDKNVYFEVRVHHTVVPRLVHLNGKASITSLLDKRPSTYAIQVSNRIPKPALPFRFLRLSALKWCPGSLIPAR